MMAYYFVKQELFGVRRGTVERFAKHKAGALVVDGMIELYDPKRHGHAPGAPPSVIEKKSEKSEAKARA